MRLRLTFSKDGPLTYTSHLDLLRVWERSLRRAGVPLAYSQGFNPRPRLQPAAALPLGHTGGAEWLDVWLERPFPVGRFARAVKPVLPAGLTLAQVETVPPKGPALQTLVVAAEYRVEVAGPLDSVHVPDDIERLLAAAELPRERRGKRYDLRPLIEALWLEDEGPERLVLGMRLAARAGATGRPEAVVDSLGLSGHFVRYHRRRLILSGGG